MCMYNKSEPLKWEWALQNVYSHQFGFKSFIYDEKRSDSSPFQFQVCVRSTAQKLLIVNFKVDHKLNIT